MKTFDEQKLNDSLSLLCARLIKEGSSPIQIVVCGGSSLIATKLVTRTTNDVEYSILLKDLLIQLGFADAVAGL